MIEGNTIYHWKVREIASGDPVAIAARARELKLRHVIVKAAEGSFRYNLRPPLWLDNVLGPYIEAMNAVGVQVWGFQYIYGIAPESEADMALEQMRKYNFAGWIVDAEGEIKGKPGAVVKYFDRLRKGFPSAEIGGTTYRWPTVHPEFPWAEFISRIDFHMPQVYWQNSHNPVWQLDRCLKEYRELEARLRLPAKPIIPIGAAYHENGWQPTTDEITAFYNAVRARNLPGVSWWEWAHSIRYGLESTIRAFPAWGEALPPAPKTLEERFDDLVAWARQEGYNG